MTLRPVNILIVTRSGMASSKVQHAAERFASTPTRQQVNIKVIAIGGSPLAFPADIIFCDFDRHELRDAEIEWINRILMLRLLPGGLLLGL